MKRYEIKRIGKNWYGIYDTVKGVTVFESHLSGVMDYAKYFAIV